MKERGCSGKVVLVPLRENILRTENGKSESDLLQKLQDINLNLMALSNEVLYLSIHY